MPNQTIYIEGINSDTGKLDLSDNGKTEVKSNGKYRKVTWRITSPIVKSFRIVGKTAQNPFETTIPAIYDTKVKLTVQKGHPAIDWEYSIHWKDKDGNVTISDPLIAIRSTVAFKSPEKDLTGSLITLIGVSLGLLGVALLYWRNKKSSK